MSISLTSKFLITKATYDDTSPRKLHIFSSWKDQTRTRIVSPSRFEVKGIQHKLGTRVLVQGPGDEAPVQVLRLSLQLQR